MRETKNGWEFEQLENVQGLQKLEALLANPRANIQPQMNNQRANVQPQMNNQRANVQPQMSNQRANVQPQLNNQRANVQPQMNNQRQFIPAQNIPGPINPFAQPFVQNAFINNND